MERLTVPDIKDGDRTICKIIDSRAVREHAMDIYWALKKYEDIGLTPAEIERLRKKRPRGKWEIIGDEVGIDCIQCSRCGVWRFGRKENYCPNCGADMRGDSHDM